MLDPKREGIAHEYVDRSNSDHHFSRKLNAHLIALKGKIEALNGKVDALEKENVYYQSILKSILNSKSWQVLSRYEGLKGL